MQTFRKSLRIISRIIATLWALLCVTHYTSYVALYGFIGVAVLVLCYFTYPGRSFTIATAKILVYGGAFDAIWLYYSSTDSTMPVSILVVALGIMLLHLVWSACEHISMGIDAYQSYQSNKITRMYHDTESFEPVALLDE